MKISRKKEVAMFLHWALVRPHLQYTLSHFEPSSATKMRINSNKINGIPPLHCRNLNTRAVKRGCRSWACSAWRRNGFGGIQEKPARADREIIGKTDASLLVVGGQDTQSLSWGSDMSKTLFHCNHCKRVEQVAQKYCASPPLQIYKARQVKTQSNLDLGAEAALSQRLN